MLAPAARRLTPVCVSVYIHTYCIHTHTHTHACILQIHTHTSTHTSTHACTHTRACWRIDTGTDLCVHKEPGNAPSYRQRPVNQHSLVLQAAHLLRGLGFWVSGFGFGPLTSCVMVPQCVYMRLRVRVFVCVSERACRAVTQTPRKKDTGARQCS